MAGIGNIGKDQLILDTSNLADSDNVGAYLRSSDGTLLTHTTVGSDEALDVHVSNEADLGVFAEDSAHSSGDNGQQVLVVRNDTKASLVDTDGDYSPLQVDADGDLYVTDTVAQGTLSDIDTSLNNIEADIDDLTHDEDAAHVSGDKGMMPLGVRNDTKSALAGTDGDYIPFIMDADGDLYVTDTVAQSSLSSIDTSLNNIEGDIDSLEQIEDSAHSSGDSGIMPLAVRNDTEGTLVDTDGDYAPLQVDSAGRLRVIADIDVTSLAEKDEDAAHSSGDTGSFVLAVRQDTLASSVSADGDYAAFKLNDRGGMWTVPVGTVADDAADTENPVKVGSRSIDGVLSAVSADDDRADAISDKYRRIYVNDGANIAMENQAVTVGTTAAILIASNLGGRRSVIIQNLGSRPIYLGKDATVTTANGLCIAPRGNIPMNLGEDVDIFAISPAAGQDVRVLEVG